jgi:predicted DNA binding CopG/RHH family protein
MNKDKRLEIRIPESELKASQDTAKALNMHHSEFVRSALKEKISTTNLDKE